MDPAYARAVASAMFARVLGDLLAEELPDGADSPLLSYLPDVHGFDHYSTFEIPGGAALSRAGTTDRAGKTARKDDASGEAASTSLIVTVRQPTEKQEADRIASGLRGIAGADIREAITAGESATFGLTVESLRLLQTAGLGDAAVGFEAVVTPDPKNPWTPSLGVLRSGGVTLRVVMLVRGGRVGVVLRIGPEVGPERPGGTDPDLALANILDGKLKAAE